MIDLLTGQTGAFLRFESGVQEIFAIQVVRARCPESLPDDHELAANSFVIPDSALRDVRT